MDMLSCHLNRLDRIPLYEQLYEYIKKEIVEGRLGFEEKLPSKRKLADFLQISHNTVDTAYNQLVAEGYVEVMPRKGYFVMAYEDLAYIPKPEQPKLPAKKSNHIRYHFHPSQIDTSSFPFHEWRKLAKQFVAEEKQELLLLGSPKGEYELQKEIANYLYHARGVICAPEQIIIGAGIEILLQQLLVLLDENTVYGVEDPGYHLIHRILSTYPKQVHPLEVDEEGLIVDRLDELAIDVAYVTPSHHFPYGNILPVNRRMQLLNWASANKARYIIEDDYDSEFRYSGKTIPSLQSMDQYGKVIYLGSFSKSLMPSIRISYMVLPETLLNKYEERLSFYHCTVSRIDQHILSEFIRKGLFEKHLNRMRKVYRQKLDIVMNALKSYCEQIAIIGGHSGLHIVLQIKNGMMEEELVERAAEQNVKVYPLSDYMLVKKERHTPTIVLGFAGIQMEELEEALNVLLKSWGIV